jgi:hypothetical protein
MEDAVRLIELLQQAAEWNDEEASIYAAQPWSCDAEAVLVTPAPNTTEPIQRGETSYDYFIESSSLANLLKTMWHLAKVGQLPIGNGASVSFATHNQTHSERPLPTKFRRKMPCRIRCCCGHRLMDHSERQFAYVV